MGTREVLCWWCHSLILATRSEQTKFIALQLKSAPEQTTNATFMFRLFAFVALVVPAAFVIDDAGTVVVVLMLILFLCSCRLACHIPSDDSIKIHEFVARLFEYMETFAKRDQQIGQFNYGCNCQFSLLNLLSHLNKQLHTERLRFNYCWNNWTFCLGPEFTL